jgi:hypothetical protein
MPQWLQVTAELFSVIFTMGNTNTIVLEDAPTLHTTGEFHIYNLVTRGVPGGRTPRLSLASQHREKAAASILANYAPEPWRCRQTD